MTDKQIRRFEYVSEQLAKCEDPRNYANMFGYKVFEKSVIDEREIKKITKGRYLTYKLVNCHNRWKKIVIKGKTLGGIGLTVNSSGFKEFKKSILNQIVEKWSKNAYYIDKKNDLRFQRKMDPFGIESHQIEPEPTNKNSKSKSSTLEKESKKFSRYLEFSKLTVPDKYAEMFGYEIKMLSPKKIKHRRVLTYKIDPAGDLFKISIKGRTLGGEMVQVSTKPFDVFREVDLKNAVSKWSGCAYRVDSKIFGNPAKVN